MYIKIFAVCNKKIKLILGSEPYYDIFYKLGSYIYIGKIGTVLDMTVDLIDKVKKYPLTVGSTVLDIVVAVKKIAFKYRSVMSKCPCPSGNILSLLILMISRLRCYLRLLTGA